MNRRVFLTASAAALALGLPARAQTTTGRPLRLVVPLQPGGATDPYARIIAEHMAKTLGRPVILENKPGGGGNVGTQYVVNAPADGQLVLLVTQSMMEINPSAFADVKWSMDDLMPLVRGITSPLVLVTNPGVPARTLPELIAWIRRNPGKLSYASYTAGTPSHFLGWQLGERFGLDLVHVPSKGTASQMSDLIAGHVLLGFAQLQASRPLIQDGKLNAIAVTSATRSRFLPAVPTLAELGHPEFTAGIWFGLMLRAGTPPDLARRLFEAAKAAHADAEVRARLEAQGFDVSGQSGAAFAAEIKTESERWARLVRASGFKAESSR